VPPVRLAAASFSERSVQAAANEAIRPNIALSGLAARILMLGSGERLTLVGSDTDRVRDALSSEFLPSRSALVLASAGLHGADRILNQLLDDLAELALGLWPRWYGRDEVSIDGLFQLVREDPRVSAPWLRAAAKRCAAGFRPRFRRAPRRLEFVQLMQAIDPANPVLIASIDLVSVRRAAATIQALEWCAGQGASIVATMPIHPPSTPPYDRILYGAVELMRPDAPVRSRFIPAFGRAHPASQIEQKVEAALRCDPELAQLFACNQLIELSPLGKRPRVDLLWREGRVVVELDGPEHRADPQFADDRHRDYELLVEGYLVLRITNNQIETDLPRAIEKIRAVVRFRRANSGKAS
jgi:very-short-patch-repair endonuclease